MIILDNVINQVMVPFLNFSYNNLYPNYGVAIILLTILIKLLLFPLTKKQFESMKATQKIQPQLKKLQEKFKGQPEKLHAEMMSLWKTNNVNPLGGCLPAILQMPFFIAVYFTVRSDTFEALLVAPNANPGMFTFWLSNLAAPDTTYILPIIIGLLTYLGQKMMITDPNQAKIMMILPFFLVYISAQLQAGVLVYWATQQLVAVIQQYIILKPRVVGNTIEVNKGE